MTSSLPPPPPPDSADVLSRFHAQLDLVDLNARQIARRLGPGAATVDDLRSFGREGLLAAARSFDEARGVPFRRWANLRIRGAMIDGVRQWGMMPRRVYRELRALSAGEAMMSAYEEDDAAGPAPTAEAADARLTQYLAGLATAVAVGAVATPVSGGDGSEGVGREPSPEEAAIDRELFARVRTIVTQLPEAERTLIERHYFGEETLEQAASALGLSKSWGSRLHARAIETIARELKKQGSS